MLISTDKNGCVDVDSEMDKILKEAQETSPEGDDTSDIGTPKTPNAQTSSSGDSPKLIEAITLLQKVLAVHGAGSSVQADTTITSSKPDTNTGYTYDEYLNEITQDLEKYEITAKPFQTFHTMT